MTQTLPFVQMIALILPALWLIVAVRDNILHPEVNRTFTTQVMSLARLREDHPEFYALHANRVVTDPRWLGGVFRLIVLAEVTVALVLCVAAGLTALSLFGAVAPDTAQAFALVAGISFAALWAGFLIGGNYFCYWMCHESAQNTHFQMMLWGLATTILQAL